MNHYHTLRQGVGRPVEIRTKQGAVHRGIVDRVDRNRVYLRPMNGGRRNFGGYGYGYYGPGYGYGWGGAAAGFALGAIATLAFLPFFFF